MKFDPLNYPFSSRRNVTYGNKGMVATSQPLAAQAGLRILREGGNAIDAAIASAITLTVVEPTSNGIGGDSFCLIWNDGELFGLNSSGPAPQGLTIEKLKNAGHVEMPSFGWEPVTVPRAPAGWSELSDRFGTLRFEKLFEPAIEYAREGFPVSPTVGYYWKRAHFTYEEEFEGALFDSWFETFAPEGQPPNIGEIWKCSDQAQTLETLANEGANDFYRGKIARKIVRFSEMTGGYLAQEDLSDFKPEWVNPMSTRYRGYDVWELPPNGQGLIALLALNILDRFDLPSYPTPELYHKQIEAIKLAFVDGKKYITDPRYMSVPPSRFLSRDYARHRGELIKNSASRPKPGKPRTSDTVYLCTADDQGNMVSYIQSNFMGFGSGIVVPHTGISLQNRGNLFSLNPDDPNSLASGKKTYHTIIPGFITLKDSPVGPFGVMGGYMQPQGHVQVVSNLIDLHLNPQSALDAPRWKWVEDRKVVVEQSFPHDIARSLRRRGHELSCEVDPGGFGRGQVILRNNGAYLGACDPRADSAVAVW